MYIEAITGPIELPISTITTDIPIDIPLNCRGVYCNTTLNAPTFISDNPADIITKFIATIGTVEWKTERTKKPTVVVMLPAIIGLKLPILDTIKPEEGANNKNTIIKGNWIKALSIASPPNPRGEGLVTNIGIV